MTDLKRFSGYPDLHRHLDGSLRESTLRELAARAGVSVPDDFRFHAGMGLQEALSRFALTLAVLQAPAAVKRVASEVCEDAASEGVTTLEIRFAPQLHRGAAPEVVVDAAIEGVDGRAGIILCGLYGDPPDVMKRLVEIATVRREVVGIDLAGGPTPGHRWSLADYVPAFRRAAERGIGRTVHAGEGRPPAEIRSAIIDLGAQRIGHATTLLADPALVDLVLARGVVIEACLTSNLHTGAIDQIAAHPLPRLLALGVKACINTDNALLSNVTARSEHALAKSLPGMNPALVAAAIANGHAAAFPAPS